MHLCLLDCKHSYGFYQEVFPSFGIRLEKFQIENRRAATQRTDSLVGQLQQETRARSPYIVEN